MIYKVSTTGAVSEVVLEDMGARTLTHPTVELDLGLEYTDDELIDSEDLATAISNGWLVVNEKTGSPASEEYVDATISGNLFDLSVETQYLDLYDAGGDQDIQSGWTDIAFDNIRKKTSGFTFVEDTTEITIAVAGTYVVNFRLTSDDADNDRVSTFGRLVLDQGSGYQVVPGSQFAMYQADGTVADSSGCAQVILDLNVGDKLKVQGDGSSCVTSATVANGCGISIFNTRGLQGLQGPAGIDGEPGPTGASGIQGSSGQDGAPGYGVYAWGKTGADGTPITLSGITVSYVSTGVYDYTLDVPYPDDTYAVIGNPIYTVTDTNLQVSNLTSTGFRVTTGQGDNGGTADVPADTQHSIVVLGAGGLSGSAGVSDHGDLAGLEDDDHPQYLTRTNFTTYSGSLQDQIDDKTDTGHTHTESNITDLDKYTQAEVDALIINDHGGLNGLSDDDHPQYLNESRGDARYSQLSHTHVEDDITDLDKYTQNEVTNIITTTSGSLQDQIDDISMDHGELTGLSDDDHPQYHNDARGDARYYTQEQVDTISGSLSSLIAVQTALATVQLDRTTNYTIGTTWDNVTFDTVSYENMPDIIERDDTNTERILIKETGTYSFSYGVVVQANSTTTYTYGRLIKNGTTEISASDSEIRTYQGERHELTGSVTTDIVAGTYVTLQLQRSSDGTVTGITSRFNAIKLDGVKGEKGDAGDQGPPGNITVSGTAYFDAYDSAGTLTLNTSWQDVPFNAIRKNSGEFTFSSPELTIPSNTTYYITARITADITSGSNRSESFMRLVKDTGSGYVEIPGSIGAMYHRLLSEGSNTATVAILDDFLAGDKIKVQVRQDSGSDTIALLANGSSLTVHIPAGAEGPQGATGLPGEDGTDGIDAGGTLAVVQARRTTSISDIPLTWTDLSFDTTDIEYDDTHLEHDDTNRDRFLVKRDGYYYMAINLSVDDEVTVRIRKNDSTVLPGSTRPVGNTSDANDMVSAMQNACVAQLTSGDYVTVQIQSVSTAEQLFTDAAFIMFALIGAKGDKGDPGPAGSGSTVNIYDEGSAVANTPHSLLNFTGTGVSVSDVDGDQVNIDISGGISGITIQDEGVPVTGGPHTTINFTGSPVSSYDMGSGVAEVWVQPPTFGTWYAWGGDETETNTNSTSPVSKATLSVTGVSEGYYRLGWYYEWRRNTTSNDYRATIVLDSTTTVMEHLEEVQDVNSWHTDSGFYITNLTAGNHSFVFSHYGEVPGNTSYTRRVRLEIWRVA